MNKWMVLTPGRSGSTFIVESISLTNSIRPFNDSLSMVHSLNDINFNIDTVDQLNFQPGNVWHSHNLNSLNFVDNNAYRHIALGQNFINIFELKGLTAPYVID